MKNGSQIFFRVLGVLFAVALIAGAGMFGYRAGFAQGVAQAPAVAKAIENAAENGQAYPQMMYQRNFGYGYFPMPMQGGYGYSPMMRGGFSHGFNPIGGLLFFLLVVFLVGGFIKMMFFRRAMWNGGHMHGPWVAPSMFDNWHKQAHGEQPESEESKKE
jgi:hypothetical protein